MADFQAWLFERLGWMPHRLRKWAEPWQPRMDEKRRVVIHFNDGDHILLASEARWLGAELLLAARDAERNLGVVR